MMEWNGGMNWTGAVEWNGTMAIQRQLLSLLSVYIPRGTSSELEK